MMEDWNNEKAEPRKQENEKTRKEEGGNIGVVEYWNTEKS
jgi:hypothetical protein